MLFHATPGLYLILNGVSAILSGHAAHLWADVLGIVAGLALLIVLKREFTAKHHAHGKVAWFEVLVGIVVMIEGFHKLHHGKSWFQPGTLLMLVGVLFIVIGIFHNQITSLRRLTCTAKGFKLRTRPIRSFSGEWQDIKSFALEGTSLVIKHQDDSVTKHSLRTIDNRAEVLSMLNEELQTSQRAQL
jgi:hypothetical protein